MKLCYMEGDDVNKEQRGRDGWNIHYKEQTDKTWLNIWGKYFSKVFTHLLPMPVGN